MRLKNLTLGLQAKIALLCFGPALVICLIFSVFFINARIDDVQETLQQEGSNIALHLSSRIHIALAEKEYELITPLLVQAKLKYPIIHQISVIDDQGNLLGGSPSPFSSQELHTNFKLSKNTPSEVDLIEKPDDFYFIMEIADIEGLYSHLGFLIVSIPTSLTAELEKKAILTTIILTLIALSLCVLLATTLGRYIAKPMILMINSAKKIQKGQYDSLLNFESFSEFELLKNTWNNMAKSIDHAVQIMQEKIKEATEQLEIKNAELNQARLKALEGEKIKAEFLANMSHEIRTPLNAILGFTDLILDESLKPNQEEHLLIIKRSAQSLLQILNDILDFSKIEAGKLLLHSETFSLRNFLQEVLTLFASQAHQKKLSLWLQIYPDVPDFIHTDSLRLKQILMNLIGNAIKFTSQGYVLIKATLNQSETHLRLEITDTGIGLSTEDQKKLFHAFSQADNSTTRQYGGTGLGLIICKKLMHLLGGEIGLISKPHQGSTFWVELSLEAQLDSSLPPGETEISRQSLRNFREGLPQSINQSPFSSLKILILESTPVGRLSFLQHLEAEEISHIRLCKTPEEFSSTLSSSEELPDLFFLSADYAEAIQKQEKKIPHLPVILFGPESSANLNTMAKKLSAFINMNMNIKATLSIPYSQDQLKAALSKATGISLRTNKINKIKALPPRLSYSETPTNFLNILVVDDHENNLQLLLKILEKFGLQAHGVSSGQEAIDWVSEHPINSVDLIFMDIQMPHMDGFTTTQKIRELPQGKFIKIFALTADLSETQQEKIKISGMDGYYLKPLSYENLTQVLAQFDKLDQEIPREKNQKEPEKSEADPITKLQLEQLPEVHQAIKNALAESNQEALLQIIHKFHGGLCYANLPELREAAKKAEQSLKKNSSTPNGPDNPEESYEKSKELILHLLKVIKEKMA